MPDSHRCVLCDSETSVLYNISCGSIYRCSFCSSEFLYANKEVKYDKSYYRSWFDNPGQQVKIIKELNSRNLFSIHFDSLQNKKLLDIGCATGFLLQEAQYQGAEVYGIDINHWAVEQAQKELPDASIYSGQLNQAIEENFFLEDYFDIIVGTDVIEHISDVKSFFKDMLRIMKKGGRAAFTTPNLVSLSKRLLGPHWFQYKSEHVSFVSQKALALLADEMGFKIEKVVPIKKVLTLGYMFNVLRHTTKGIARWCGSSGEIFIKFLSLSGVRFSFRTGEMLFIISKL